MSPICLAAAMFTRLIGVASAFRSSQGQLPKLIWVVLQEGALTFAEPISPVLHFPGHYWSWLIPSSQPSGREVVRWPLQMQKLECWLQTSLASEPHSFPVMLVLQIWANIPGSAVSPAANAQPAAKPEAQFSSSWVGGHVPCVGGGSIKRIFFYKKWCKHWLILDQSTYRKTL